MTAREQESKIQQVRQQLQQFKGNAQSGSDHDGGKRSTALNNASAPYGGLMFTLDAHTTAGARGFQMLPLRPAANGIAHNPIVQGQDDSSDDESSSSEEE
jgi:hypothetical protein